jgi:AcrR family transcriptional regulator
VHLARGSRGSGRPPAASREDVIAAATRRFLRSERVDVSAISEELGTSRMTINRWFGSRDGLIGEVCSVQLERIIREARAAAVGTGAEALLDTFDRINRVIAGADPIRAYLHREQGSAFRVLASSEGPVRARAVGAITALIRDEMTRSRWRPPTDPEMLAYAIVRLAEAFLYSDTLLDIRGEVEHLLEIEAALMNLPNPRAP